jgi:hypothetical protein
MEAVSRVVCAACVVAVIGCGNSDDGRVAPVAMGGGYGAGGWATGGVPGPGGSISSGGAIVPSGGAPGSGGAGGAGGVVTMGGSGGTVATGGTVGTGAAPGSGGANVIPPDPNTVTLTMDSFTVAPGAEVYMCQNYDNPFGGQDAGIAKFVTDMSPGSHHLHLFYKATSTDRKLESCSGLEFHPLLHASGRPHQEEAYPPDMAAKLKGTDGVRLQVHYLNTTPDTLTVSASTKLTKVANPSAITKWVGQLYFNRVYLQVPPGSGKKVTTSCSVPQGYGPISLIGAGSHMHRRGVHFVATTSTGLKLLETSEWAEPAPVAYDPPIVLNAGDRISWECTYDNGTGRTLTFGESADTNEMCIYLARFYSTPNGDQIECQSTGPTGP